MTLAAQPVPPRVSVLRIVDQPVQPWRNGGGSTRQVAIDPCDAVPIGWRWRVSIAQVGRDGPFSSMPGVDRCLWLLRGNGMRLLVDGEHVVLDQPLQRFDFAGETAIVAHLLDGPCEDLNVMTARAVVRTEAEVVDVAAAATLPMAPAPQRLVVVLAGAAVLVDDGSAVSAGEALRIEGGSTLALRAGPAPSRLLVVAFFPRP